MYEINCVKFPPEMQNEIDILVANGTFETKSLLIRTAIRKLLKEQKENTKE